VDVALTAANVPVLVPLPRLKAKALLDRPLIALPELSFTTIVTRSVLPEVTVDDARLTLDPVALTVPGVTATVGWLASVTPPTVTVSVLAVPAVVAVKVAV
jgi:hypothetical protein